MLTHSLTRFEQQALFFVAILGLFNYGGGFNDGDWDSEERPALWTIQIEAQHFRVMDTFGEAARIDADGHPVGMRRRKGGRKERLEDEEEDENKIQRKMRNF